MQSVPQSTGQQLLNGTAAKPVEVFTSAGSSLPPPARSINPIGRPAAKVLDSAKVRSPCRCGRVRLRSGDRGACRPGRKGRSPANPQPARTARPSQLAGRGTAAGSGRLPSTSRMCQNCTRSFRSGEATACSISSGEVQAMGSQSTVSKSVPDSDRDMPHKLHLGCFDRPIDGWINTDVTPHLRIARVPFLATAMRQMGLMNEERYRQHQQGIFRKVRYLNVAKPFPFSSDYFECVFSSHMPRAHSEGVRGGPAQGNLPRAQAGGRGADGRARPGPLHRPLRCEERRPVRLRRVSNRGPRRQEPALVDVQRSFALAFTLGPWLSGREGLRLSRGQMRRNSSNSTTGPTIRCTLKRSSRRGDWRRRLAVPADSLGGPGPNAVRCISWFVTKDWR